MLLIQIPSLHSSYIWAKQFKIDPSLFIILCNIRGRWKSDLKSTTMPIAKYCVIQTGFIRALRFKCYFGPHTSADTSVLRLSLASKEAKAMCFFHSFTLGREVQLCNPYPPTKNVKLTYKYNEHEIPTNRYLTTQPQFLNFSSLFLLIKQNSWCFMFGSKMVNELI